MTGTIIKTADRETWLEERKKGIGASEAAAVAGVSEYQTALDIYLRKIGASAEQEETEAMAWGTRLEPQIADAYSERVGVKLTDEQVFLRCAAHPFMLATLDRLREDGRPVELKTVGWRAAMKLQDDLGESGTDRIPYSWYLQVMHQMIVTGADAVDVAALIGGQELRIYTIPYDKRIAERLLGIEADFWECVHARRPPKIDPKRDADKLAHLYPGSLGVVDADPEISILAAEWETAKREAAEAQERADDYRSRLLVEMKGLEGMRLSDGRTLTRKVSQRGSYIVKPSIRTELRIKKGE